MRLGCYSTHAYTFPIGFSSSFSQFMRKRLEFYVQSVLIYLNLATALIGKYKLYPSSLHFI